jgi:hypothetical protein
MPISLAWPDPSSERSPIWHEAHRCRGAGRRETRRCYRHSIVTGTSPGYGPAGCIITAGPAASGLPRARPSDYRRIVWALPRLPCRLGRLGLLARPYRLAERPSSWPAFKVPPTHLRRICAIMVGGALPAISPTPRSDSGSTPDLTTCTGHDPGTQEVDKLPSPGSSMLSEGSVHGAWHSRHPPRAILRARLLRPSAVRRSR